MKTFWSLLVHNKKKPSKEDVVHECTDFPSNSPLQSLPQGYSSSIVDYAEKKLAPGKNEPTLKNSNVYTE